MLEVTLLSVLQGVAEFLPISSSGHLVIGQHLLGMNAPGVRLDVFLHVGTLVSICAFYRRTIVRILRNLDWAYAAKVLVSALPAVAVYFLFGELVRAFFEDARTVGALLMFTGTVLIGTRFLPRGEKDVSLLRALLMGFCQALALLPGVSRSGMTLAGARAGKVEAEKAAEFSFLMSMPLILGAAVLEFADSLNASAPAADEVSWPLTVYGAALAAVVGYFSLKILVAVLRGRWFWLFGLYCLAAGLLTFLFF